MAFNYVSFLTIAQKKDALAATILFYCTLTFATFLRVGLYPIRCFAVIPTLFEPVPRNSAYGRSMITLHRASEAESMISKCSAANYRNKAVSCKFPCSTGTGNSMGAIWIRTEL